MKVTTAVANLFGESQRPAGKPVVYAFEVALKCCQAANQSLDRLPVLEPAQKLRLASVLLDLREKGQGDGSAAAIVVGMSGRKSTPEEIRQRFDNDVERFSNLDTGQSATIDAPLSLELIARAASGVNPEAAALLDIGCGAGNYTLKLLQHLPLRSVTLIDLSRPMLDRAVERIHGAAPGLTVTAIQGDIRETPLADAAFDVAVAAATLHHLRDDHEWQRVFAAVYRALVPGGGFWISDFVAHQIPAVQDLMWQRYGEYLTALQGPAYRDRVFAYVDAEDSPRPLVWQLDLLDRTGFRSVEVLHKNSCFAAFGAVK